MYRQLILSFAIVFTFAFEGTAQDGAAIEGGAGNLQVAKNPVALQAVAQQEERASEAEDLAAVQGEGASEVEDLAALQGKTAGALCAFTVEMAEAGRFSLAGKALARAEKLGLDGPAADEARALLESRRAAFPPTASPLDLKDEARDLYNAKAKSLSGWKIARGKWTPEPNGPFCESTDGEAYLYRSGAGAPVRYRLAFQLKTSTQGDKAGVVLGANRKGKVGVVFQADGISLFDFKSMGPLGEVVPFKMPVGKQHLVNIEVRGEAVSVRVRNKTALEGFLAAMKPGRLGLFATGQCLFVHPKQYPLEEDVLLERAKKALKSRKDRGAAIYLLRARELDGAQAEAAALLAETLARLDFHGESARCYMAYLALAPDPKDRFHRTALKEARKAVLAAEEGEARLPAMEAKFVDGVEVLVLDRLAAGRVEEARAGIEALEMLEAFPDKVAELSARTFLAERGGAEEVRLFTGKDLDGWKKVSGEWAVGEEGALEGACGLDGKAVLEAEPLPAFERFLIHTQQRGTGAYLDQGIRLMAGKEAFEFHLYKPMVGHSTMTGKRITVEKNNASVLFKGMQELGLSASQWYDVDLLVDHNLATLLFNGIPLFTKVLPRQGDARVLLYITAGRKGKFRDVAFKPFGSDEAFSAFLEEMGLHKRCVVEAEDADRYGVASGPGGASGPGDSSGSGGSTGPGSAKNPGSVREQPFAYNGRVMAGGLQGKAPFRCRFKSLNLPGAMLSLRYAAPGDRYADAKAVTRLAVTVDGEPCDEILSLQPTGGAKDFIYARAGIGDLARGWHDLSLSLLQGGKGVVLDRLEITGPDHAPEGEVKLYTSEKLKHFKIRLSPGIDLPGDVEEIFALLELSRAYMVDYYGFEPADPLYFNLIARECWADPHKGGYAGGDNLYIPEDITFSSISTIMHEMSHCFDYRQGFNPPWFGEGKSFPCFDQFAEESSGRYRRYYNPFTRSGVKSGKKSFDLLEHGGENLFQFWGTAKFPYWGKTPDGRNLTHQGYASANWLCMEFSKFLGPTWLKDYFTLLRRDIEGGCYFMPKDRVYANSVIVDYFTRSSGEDCMAFFRQHRFHVHDIYDYETLEVACGEGDGDYLVESEGMTVRQPPEQPKARYLEKGFLRYVFPVSPEAMDLTIEVTKRGRGMLEAEGKILFREGFSDRRETKRCRLNDPELWDDARLVIRFSADCKEDAGLYVEKIVIRR